ncbi:MAG: zinc-ribbon domain-containing protein [Lachnospiraceae bacterium]|nr:zinc-ribbon domain-containing protein [Lachnospiraceae bacterium]
MARYCESCGSLLKEDAKFCENCGASVTEQPDMTFNDNTSAGAGMYTDQTDTGAGPFQSDPGMTGQDYFTQPDQPDFSQNGSYQPDQTGFSQDNSFQPDQTGFSQGVSYQPEGGQGQSVLAIISLVLSCTCCLSFFGVVVGIIDLVVNRNDGKKHTLSIVGIAVGLLFLIFSAITQFAMK